MIARTPFRLTMIHPCVGRRAGDRSYIRAWQMEPLVVATLAGLTPADVDLRFYDDRLEEIPYEEPTDLVAISVETYTARRAYQIASAYRKRGVPVVMGGFHAGLMPDEAAHYAEAVVVGEAELTWAHVIDDARAGRLQQFYRSEGRPSLDHLKPDRRLFHNKRYLPIGLIEAGRGCRFQCEFCAIQVAFNQTQSRRPIDSIIDEVRRIKDTSRLIFFVDDNVFATMDEAKALLRALIPLRIRWVSQCSINAAHDEEFLSLLKQSGCLALLIGIESLDANNLEQMSKGFNLMRGGLEPALANLRRYGICVYGTFIFGYDHDTTESFEIAADLARRQAMYIAAFNPLTPFPGTPVYDRLKREGRLLYESWWLDERYRYNTVPFQPHALSPQEIQAGCLNARRRFYSWASMLHRGAQRVNWRSGFMARNFPLINLMHRRDISARDGLPLGDESFQGSLVKVC